MGCKVHEPKKVEGVILPAQQDPTLPLNPSEESLDNPATLVVAKSNGGQQVLGQSDRPG
jgi:hypothetical protein